MASEDLYKGNIYWRENKKKWQGILFYTDSNGKRHQKTKLFNSKKRESKTAFELWKMELNKDGVEASEEERSANHKKAISKMTVGERVAEYLDYFECEVAMGNKQKSTLIKKRQQASLYIYPENLSRVRYVSVTKEDILKWEMGLKNRGLSNSTISNPFAILRCTYGFDLEHGRIKETPFRFLKSPKQSPKGINYATDKALRQLNEAIEERWNKQKGDSIILCYCLALYTGMRCQEICGLTWKDIHFDKGYIEVTQAIGRDDGKGYVKPPKTKRSRRIIPIVGALVEKLKERKEHVCSECGVKEPGQNWFVTGDKDRFKKPSSVSNTFSKFVRRRGIVGSEGRYLTLHGLRDTIATIAVQEKSVDIKTLSALMGHSQTSTTLNKYAGYGDETMRELGMKQIEIAMIRKMS